MRKGSLKGLGVFVRAGAVLVCGGLILVAPLAKISSASSINAPASSFHQQPQTSAEQLTANKPLEHRLAGGETYRYEINLPANQLLQVTVDQRGIDVDLTVFDQANNKVLRVDNRRGERGLEKASLVSEGAGVYRVDIRSVRKTDPPGSYQITLVNPHPVTEIDRTIIKADQLIAEARLLMAQSTRESSAKALAKCQEARALVALTNDLPMQASVLNLIGRNQNVLGDYKQALESHNRALELARAAGEQYDEAETLTAIGQIYRGRAEQEQALDFANQALVLWQHLQDRRAELGALVTAGRICYEMAAQPRALFYYDLALKLSRTLSDASQELMTQSSIALSYYVLSENEEAAEHWKQALALAVKTNNRGMEANVLGKLGAAYGAMNDQPAALSYLNRAIELARERGDKIDEAGSLQTMARLYRSAGDPRKSIEYLDQSLVVLKGVNNPTSFARSHYNLGKAYTDLGEYEKAIDYLRQAEEVYRSKKDSINMASTIRELARAERGRGNLQTALTQSQTALNLIDWLRTNAGSQEQRSTYFASVQDYFELQIDVLTRLHGANPAGDFAAQALQTSERARARSLLETLAEAGVDIRRGINPELLEQERAIAEQLSSSAAEHARLTGIKSATESLSQLDRKIKDLTVQYENIEAQIRAASPAYSQLLQPRPVTLTEIREQVIDRDTLLLEYYLGADRSYLWAVTSASIDVFELPKRAVIESAARHVHGLLTARNRPVRFETSEERSARLARADADAAAAVGALSEMVLKPVAPLLTRKRLLVVADGALQYVPFAALPKPGAAGHEPLANYGEVVSLPSASTLAILRQQISKRQPAPKTITVLADPVFNADDERVKAVASNRVSPSTSAVIAQRSSIVKSEIKTSASESGWESEAPTMVRLPFTRREADAAVALVPVAFRREQLGFEASLANAVKGDLSQYRIVHFATHGFLNSRHPELSGIVLSLIDDKGQDQDGFLRAHQIYDLKLPADLVVLSGCRTGLGKEIRGEGLIGLTRAFMHAGSARVLVSLWDVNDQATAELMQRFYLHLLGPEKMSPAAALRAAQVSMAADKRWSAPYYWAGFILQGEPR